MSNPSQPSQPPQVPASPPWSEATLFDRLVVALAHDTNPLHPKALDKARMLHALLVSDPRSSAYRPRAQESER